MTGRDDKRWSRDKDRFESNYQTGRNSDSYQPGDRNLQNDYDEKRQLDRKMSSEFRKDLSAAGTLIKRDEKEFKVVLEDKRVDNLLSKVIGHNLKNLDKKSDE